MTIFETFLLQFKWYMIFTLVHQQHIIEISISIFGSSHFILCTHCYLLKLPTSENKTVHSHRIWRLYCAYLQIWGMTLLSELIYILHCQQKCWKLNCAQNETECCCQFKRMKLGVFVQRGKLLKIRTSGRIQDQNRKQPRCVCLVKKQTVKTEISKQVNL